MSHEVFHLMVGETAGHCLNLLRWFLQISGVMSRTLFWDTLSAWILAVWSSRTPSLSVSGCLLGSHDSLSLVSWSFFKAVSWSNVWFTLSLFPVFQESLFLLPMSHALKTIISYTCPLWWVMVANLVLAIWSCQQWESLGVSETPTY